MPRQRIIKPDFWADEKIGKLSLLARLLFIGIWNFADDKGICRSSPAFLRSQIFQYDEFSLGEINAALKELQLSERVNLAEISGESFLIVNNFRKHQRIDRPSDNLFIKNISNDKLLELFYSSSHARALDESSLPNIREAKLSEAKVREEKALSHDEVGQLWNDKVVPHGFPYANFFVPPALYQKFNFISDALERKKMTWLDYFEEIINTEKLKGKNFTYFVDDLRFSNIMTGSYQEKEIDLEKEFGKL